jgi:hypothetical protein
MYSKLFLVVVGRWEHNWNKDVVHYLVVESWILKHPNQVFFVFFLAMPLCTWDVLIDTAKVGLESAWGEKKKNLKLIDKKQFGIDPFTLRSLSILGFSF